MQADAAGPFRFASLPAGRYALETVAAGFKRFRATATVAADKASVVTVRLELGDVSEAMTPRGRKRAGHQDSLQESAGPKTAYCRFSVTTRHTGFAASSGSCSNCWLVFDGS